MAALMYHPTTAETGSKELAVIRYEERINASRLRVAAGEEARYGGGGPIDSPQPKDIVTGSFELTFPYPTLLGSGDSVRVFDQP
jgi:hypothetical protein